MSRPGPAPVRVGIVGVFLLCGGLVGGAILSLGVIAWALWTTPGDAGWLALLLQVPAGMVVSIALGLPYAVLAGVVYANLSSALQRPIMAVPIGALSVLSWHGLYALLGADFGLELVSVFALVGGLAALVCAFIVRLLGLDWEGAAARETPYQG